MPLRTGQIAGTTLYQGPNGLTGWTTYEPGSKSWQYANGALSTKSSRWIGRNVRLSAQSCVEFSFSNPGLPDAFFVGLYSSIPPTKDYYSFGLFRNAVLLDRVDSEGHGKLLGEIPHRYSYTHPDVRVRILADKIGQNFWLYFDGMEVGHWHDPEPCGGIDTGITFQTFERKTDTRISGIRISSWNGEHYPAKFEEPR